jgi:hypothetical protein
MVTVLSCVVLGTVWGFVVNQLPDSTNLPQPVSSLPTPSPPPPTMQTLPEPALPAAASPPILVKQTPVLDQTRSPARSAAEVAPLSFVTDVKCAMEIDSLCQEGEEDRRSCLQSRSAQLSIPCRPVLRERLVRMKETMQLLRSACEEDRRRFCANESLGEGTMVQCLESHAQEVTDACFQMLRKRGRVLN